MTFNTDIITQNSTVSYDTAAPISYNEWLLHNTRVAVEDSVNLYNTYIYNWYQINNKSNNNTATIKQEYINLLKELLHFFNEEEKNLFIKDINFNDDVELIYSIPFFVQKLKQIALTVAKRRESVKNARLKYNLIGSTKGVEKILQDYILKNFTKSIDSVQLSISTAGTTFPTLSSVQDNFTVELEEIYDSSTYTDSMSSTSTTAHIPQIYENALQSIFAIFLQQYEAGTLPLSAFNEFNVLSTPAIYNEIKLNSKYLGNNLYNVSVSGMTSIAIHADAPYLNIENVFNATIALSPNITGFTIKEDTGGFLLPHTLGVPYYLGHGYINTLDLTKLATQNNDLFLNPDIYTSNRGLSQTDNKSPYLTTYIDNTWIKASSSNYKKAGVPINAINYQKFVPYQSNYETNKVNIYGVSRQNDNFEFWSGSNSNIWNDEISYPLNYKKEGYKVAERAQKLLVTDKIVTDWETDIYGNNYSIYKSKALSISSLTTSSGELWIRNTNDNIYTGTDFLSSVYTTHLSNTTYYQELTNNQIISLNIFDDVLMIRTIHGVSLNKIIYDLITGTVTSADASSAFISLTPASGTYSNFYSGYWYDEYLKCVYINTIQQINTSSTTSLIYTIYSYNLKTNIFVTYLQDTISLPVFISNITDIKQIAAFTYNQDSNTFNTTMTYGAFNIIYIDAKNYKDNPYISNVTIIR